MSKLQIRPARRDDIATILMLSIGGNAPGREIVDDPEAAQSDDYQRAFDRIEKDPNNLFFIAELKGEAVGCMQINLLLGIAGRGRLRAQLEGVHIRADHRGQGLGGEMMQWAIAFAKSKGAGMVQLTSSKNRPEAHRFYERLGFVRSHEGFKLSL
ncbi:GNAT family N-acetyltransferase [Maritalea mediterranea]|uniref:GNAT family N-acetyltransferase n=1 Tax=Maritalea mediterranea TaxID=2909667 RepID=A0ABS9E806_9HYPH|nr:GNAT family N-acetyltransferase [Maritalea mediterranea]MCF4099012.1 GNAT family N-acetyltransferase [Maritalea mediterranea]